MPTDRIRENKKIIQLANWVKNNSHSLREISLLFFALALFTGVIWISGKDVEPIAYVFGLISSILFASPAIMRYAYPDRKAVRHMNYDEILEFITTSNAKQDWKWIATNWAEEAFLKEDPRLRIRVRRDEAGLHMKDFNAAWAVKHAQPTANSYWYDLSYDGALIDRFILVSIDEGKPELPLPIESTYEVEPLNYKVAQIFDEHDSLDEYMKTAGLTVRKT